MSPEEPEWSMENLDSTMLRHGAFVRIYGSARTLAGVELDLDAA